MLKFAQFIAGLLEVYLCWMYVKTLYGKNLRFSPKSEKFVIFASSFFLAAIAGVNRNIRLFSFVLIIFLIISLTIFAFIIYNNKFLSIFMCICFYMLFIMIIDIFIIFLAGMILHDNDYGIYIGKNLCLERVIILYITRIFILSIFIWIRKKITTVEYSILIRVFIIAVIINTLALFYFHPIYMNESLPDMSPSIIAYIFFCILMLCGFVVYVFISKLKEERTITRIKMEWMEHSSNNLFRYYKEYKRNFHDLKNHLIILSQYITDEEKEKALEYIKSIQKPIDYFSNTVWSGNGIIDMIINYKYQICKNEKIHIDFEIDNFSDVTLEISDNELCSCLSNLLDNAIEACKFVSPDERWIKLKVLYRSNMLYVCIKNSLKILPIKTDNKFLSTKKDNIHHGIGLESIKDIVEKYNGHINILYDDEKYIVEIVI